MKVMDGSGEETQLRITVKGRRQYTLTKMGFEYGISSGAPTELLGDVSKVTCRASLGEGWRVLCVGARRFLQ